MVGSLPLEHWYVGFLGASVLVLAVTGYVVYARTDTHHRSVFVGYVVFESLWLLGAMGQLLTASPRVMYALSLFSNAFGLMTVAALGYFATVYSNRSTAPTKPRNAAFLCWFVVGLGGILTQPLFGLQYASVTYRDGAVAYLAIEPGPIFLLNVVATVLVLAVSIGYLARLFVTSPHRPRSSILLLVAAAAVSLLPTAIITFVEVPVLPGYDYTVFGAVPFTVVLAYTVFFRGELDLAPMARTEVVDAIDDVLFGLDDAGRIIDYNAAARSLLPPETDDPVGTPLSEVLPELADQLGVTEGPDKDVTATYTTVIDGTRTHYSVSLSPIRERGGVAGYSVILRDVTAAETETRELQRQNDQLESFASTVAHDLRNPLQVADGTTTLLTTDLRDGAESHPAVSHLEGVEEAVSRMDTALAELQTLAKHAQSVTETEELDFEETVRSAWESVGDGPSLSVPTGGTITAEPTRLDSILETLCRHSAEYGGSTIVVTLTDTGFTYEDEGLRIPDDDQVTVFDSETTTGPDIGLALQIVRTQVESQGWRVAVESAERGTRFRVTGAVTNPNEGVEATG